MPFHSHTPPRLSTMRHLALLVAPLLVSAASAAEKPVSFTRDIMPIFQADCNGCHKPGKAKGKLDMSTYTALMKGGKTPITVEPGKPKESELFKMISGPSPEMPEDGDPLKPEQVALIERWIREGAKDDSQSQSHAPKKIQPPTYALPPVVSSIALSPDGKLLAVSGYHEVILRSSDGQKLLGRLVGDSPRIESIAFSPSGDKLAVVGGSPAEFGEAQVWDVKSGSLLKSWKFGHDSLYGVSFSPDGDTIAFGGAEKVVRAVNIDDGKVILEFKAHSDWVTATAFADGGKRLISGARDKAIKMVDLKNGQFIDDINNPLEAVVSMARHPKEEWAVYGGDMGTARIYQISDNQKRTNGRLDTNLIRAFERQKAPVSAVAFNPAGDILAVGAKGEVNLYNVKDGSKVAACTGITGPVFSIVFTPDGKQLAAGGFDGQLRFYDAATGNLIRELSPVPLEKVAAN